MNKDILICGVGGQGTVLASKLLAGAAMRLENTVHSAETIGMAQRGGSVTSHVRIGNDAYSPLIPSGHADMIIGFEPAEAVRNLAYLKQNGTVIVNRIPVMPTTESLNAALGKSTGEQPYDGVSMIEYLQKKCNCIVMDAEAICTPLGTSKCFNVAIIGAAVGSGKLGIDEDTMLEEIERSVPPRFIDLNKKAFLIGIEMVKKSL